VGRQPRERDRYRRASLAERLRSVPAGLRGRLGIVAFLIFMAGGWAVFTLTSPSYLPAAALATGDCLYIPNPSANSMVPGLPAIGTQADVVGQLFDRGAERASCTASHGHEVLLTWTYPDAAGVPYPSPAALTDGHAESCAAAFPDYVGHPVEGSGFAITVGVPNETQWKRGARTGVCLLARADGEFMAQPARGSGG
jgi:hypothetical protein